MTDDKPNWPTETGADLDALVQRLQKLGLDMDRHANEEWDEHEDVFAAVNAITDLRARCADHEAEVARLTAERDSATRAKDCFQRMTRAHWEALCAMRNSINEYIQMPNTDSGPLFSPEDGPIYADIAERVIADLAESRAYALALEQELRDRAEKAEADRDAALAGAVKVKPLVWFEVEKSRYGGKYTADGYTIRYIEGLWLLDFAGQSKAIWRFPTIEAAKSAAQADYEARYLAAIQPDPDARQAALVKAFCMGRDMAAAWHEGREQDELAIASKYRGGSNPWFSHCQSAKGHKDASDAIRALTPPADLAAKIGGE